MYSHANGIHAMRILIIEDEPKVAKALAEGLRAEQFEVSICKTGEEGYFVLSTEHVDLLLLDLMLPVRDGFTILRALRGSGKNLPVLIMTAKDAVEDRVRGLDCGADDYLIKPFAFSELMARIRALLRRGSPEEAARVKCVDLEIDYIGRRISRGGRELQLTAKEFELCTYLARHQGNVVSREAIARDLWKIQDLDDPMDNIIDVHIARLRRKLDDPFPRKLLRTIRGVGFLMEG